MFYIFKEEGMDYAVVETGMGGLFDGSNCVDSEDKIAVITRIGMDHQHILGNKIEQIAEQKAGIINKGNRVFSINQGTKLNKIFKERAKKMGSEITFVKADKRIKLDNINVSQVENASVALAVYNYILTENKKKINKRKVEKKLSSVYIPGRTEFVKKRNKIMILDGAHNIQKINSLVQSIKKKYGKKKFDIVFSSKKGRSDLDKILKEITSIASSISYCDFSKIQDMPQSSEEWENIKKILDKLKYKNYKHFNSIKEGIRQTKNNSNMLIVTGSFYILEDARKEFLK